MSRPRPVIGGTWLAIASLAIAGASGCRACEAERRAAPVDVDAASGALTNPQPSAETEGDPRTGFVRHDCTGIEPEVDCAATHGAGDLLMRFSETLTELLARHDAPPATFWDAGRAALAEATGIEVSTLGYAERVHIQNAALHLAISAEGRKQSELARSAAALVRKLAFDAAGRKPADPPMQVETWLGPQSSWTERSKTTPMLHEEVFDATRLVRIVRTPVVHANFTQLLAVGVDGRPFLTPVVGSIEIRRGEEHTSPACVAFTSPERVRCSLAAGLVGARNIDELPKSHFFIGAREGRLRCNGCHTAAAEDVGMLHGMANVDAGALPAELSRREALLVEKVSRVLAKLWR